MSHTKGPWRLEDNGGSTRIETLDGKPIGAAWECKNDFANANLMAAAPDLLKALELIHAAVVGLDSIPMASTQVIQETVINAIRKARGESK